MQVNPFIIRLMSARLLPYRPLWLFRFFETFHRLLMPSWLLTLLIIVIVGVANHLVAWQNGILLFGQIDGYLATVGLYIVLMPAVWVLSSERAQRAVLEFFKESGKSRAQVQATVSDFNSLPNWVAILLLVFGFLQGYWIYSRMTVVMIPVSAKVLPSLGLLSWLSTNSFLYLVIGRGVRQLVLIKRAFNELKVDIFNRRPIYALSRYASWISIMALVVAYGFQSISFPSLLLTPVGIILQLLTLILAFSLFLIPLIDVNMAMRDAKERLLSEMNKDLKSLQQRVHHSVDRKTLADISNLRTAVGALKDEMEMVQKIPAWPWQPETLRNLFTPLLIPIIVYLFQRFLGGMLGL